MDELSEADLLELEALSELGNLIVKWKPEIKEIARELDTLFKGELGTHH